MHKIIRGLQVGGGGCAKNWRCVINYIAILKVRIINIKVPGTRMIMLISRVALSI